MKKNYLKSKNEFIPKNTKKYVGAWPIYIKSSWERKFCTWVDVDPNIIEWSSESIIIPYLDPSKPGFNKIRRYYPDFWIKTRNLNEFIIEVKPLRETRPPRASKKKSIKTVLTEQKTYKTNMAKFEAAIRYADEMGMTFKILTEKQLFGRKK